MGLSSFVLTSSDCRISGLGVGFLLSGSEVGSGSLGSGVNSLVSGLGSLEGSLVSGSFSLGCGDFSFGSGDLSLDSLYSLATIWTGP